MVRGIDVSDYQGTVNWPAVARAGIEFAVTKATEGGTFVADSFTRNWSGIRSAGLVRGAYHFYRPRTDALAQANLFLNIVKLQPGIYRRCWILSRMMGWNRSGFGRVSAVGWCGWRR